MDTYKCVNDQLRIYTFMGLLYIGHIKAGEPSTALMARIWNGQENDFYFLSFFLSGTFIRANFHLA